MPHAVTTTFDHVNETIWVPLTHDAIVIRYDVFQKGRYYFRPLIGMRKDWDSTVGPFSVDWPDHGPMYEPHLVVQTQNPRYHGPKYLAIGSSQHGQFFKKENWPGRSYDRDSYRHDIGSSNFVYRPGKVEFELSPEQPLYIICTVSDDKNDLSHTIEHLASQMDKSLWEVLGRVESKVDSLDIHTNSASLDKALNWALASADSLTMNVADRGIFAGLHWFTQYWGRDTFISLQGAVLINRDFALARQFIETMANAQDVNFNSRTFGRVPNVLQNPEAGANNYETADGILYRTYFTYVLKSKN